MCLIAIAHLTTAVFPLVIAANRDELYDRPTRPAHAWTEDPSVVGGRDLRAGGSWLAARRGGRFAAVTNVRDARAEGGPSRGLLVSDFVRGIGAPPLAYARAIRGQQYSGFHLIVGDAGTLVHCSNSPSGATVIEPGVFAISNATPGAHWPKVDIGRDHLAGAMSRHSAPDALADDLLGFLSTPRGKPIEAEVFVHTPLYGTRSSTVIIEESDGAILFVEQNYDATGARDGDARRFRFPSRG
jgi:uncharacterized protein with NRDE domain